MYWVVGIGFAYSLAVLVISLAMGRQKPVHFVPWVVAIVVLSVDTALHAAMSIGSMIESPGGGGWVGIGTLGIAAFLIAAIFQPRLAGWTFASTAVLMPAALFVVSQVPGIDQNELAPMGVMLGIYSTRALIVGLLLVFSMGFRRSEQKVDKVPATTHA